MKYRRTILLLVILVIILVFSFVVPEFHDVAQMKSSDTPNVVPTKPITLPKPNK